MAGNRTLAAALDAELASRMDGSINGDLTCRAFVDSRFLEWMPSPSGTVWRKRLHRVGPIESGQVTTVVRYDPGASFPTHDHPEGEEILVLDGVFSDEHGDWHAGSYLLNPEGFRHAPFSRSGCLLFVKLRQFPGVGRKHVVCDTHSLPWESSLNAGVKCKLLYRQAEFVDSVRLEKWAPATDCGIVQYDRGAELFVVEGEFSDIDGSYAAGCWLRLPAGTSHHPRSAGGCTVYIKEAGLAYLRSAV